LKVSFIIPTYGRAQSLKRTLQSMVSFALNQDAEIIVVDNASPDDTAKVCKEYAQGLPQGKFRYFFEPIPGLLSGRHRGAQEAAGDVFIFLDDDVVLHANWWKGLQEAFSSSNVGMAGGPSYPVYEVSPPDWLEGLWEDFEGGRHCGHLSLINQGNTPKEIEPIYIWGLNFSIRRDVFFSCGGFHPDCMPKSLQRYQGDGETGLSRKIQSSGYRSLYHPDLAVDHYIPAYRLEPQAFESRAFYQGVCDSYTRIREKGCVANKNRMNPFQKIYRSLQKKAEHKKVLKASTLEEIEILMNIAYRGGYEFHQGEVRKDPSLLDWVLKPDYFDYSLPVGWEKYLN
jgi:glycosyltransferase involved in cell wall biosynthesis